MSQPGKKAADEESSSSQSPRPQLPQIPKPKRQPNLTVQNLKLVLPNEVTPNIPDPDLERIPAQLPKPPFRWMLNGPSGSGKSNLFKWLLTQHYCGVFTNIYLFCPTFFNDRTLGDLLKYEDVAYYEDSDDEDPVIVSEVSERSPLREEDIIDEADPAVLLEVFKEKWDKCMSDFRADPFCKSLFILDDLGNELGRSPVIKNYFTKGRKGGISIIFMSHQYNMFNPTIRNQCTHYTFFKPATDAEADLMIKDHFGSITGRFASKKDIRSSFMRGFHRKGDFVHVDKARPNADGEIRTGF